MNSELLQSLDKLMPSLEALFDAIAARTSDGVGISRDAYGEVETAAADILIEYARSEGLDADYDRVGNVNVTAAGQFQQSPDLLIGSHVDSVPRGGNYDGLAGVIAGIGVLSSLQKAGALPRHNVRVLGFRGEESPWFGTAYLGSKLFTGQLSRSDAGRLRRFDTGKPLVEHMTGIGVRLSDIGSGPAIPLDRVRAYLELHIEQGPVLEALGRPIGIVTAIRGNIRHPFAKCFGRYAHSAAVPRHLRSDALMATVKLIAHADERWRTLIEAGHDDLVFTCGIFHTDPAEHAMTKVPGEVTFSFNVGSISDEAMDDMHRTVMVRADHLAREHNVRFEFGERVGTPAVALNQHIAAILQRSGENLGIPIHRMPTVGHDAAMFARMGIPTCMILVRNANGSHNPAEHMEMDDFGLGVRILASSLAEIATANMT
jgi:N-carbamoyl-L-amino-acid hydrolase